MDQAWDKAHGPWPGTAAVQVRELSWQGLPNPCPQSKDPGSPRGSHGKQLVEERLSPAQLRALAQVDDLRLVTMLEMCVSTRESSLGNFGVHLPNLTQLKLNGSCLGSVRDLGTSLGRLQVLWLACCGLMDLDGIGCFPALKELYVSYNNISDLSPLCLLEQLEVLDLEGNSVEDLEQVRYLQLCPRLATLTLEGNLVCLRPGPGASDEAPRGYDYRAEVRTRIPQLQVLDDVPAAHTGAPGSQKLNQDWFVVKEAIKEGSGSDGLFPGLDHPHGAPVPRLGSQLSLPETQPWASRAWPLSLLVTGGPLPGGLLPKDPAPQDDASNLTHGASGVLCGNPTKGLWERRQHCQARAALEHLAPQEDPAASASPGPDPVDSSDLLALARLRARRELHLRPLPGRCLESQQESATASWGPRRGLEERDDKSRPRTPSGPLCLAPEPSRTLGCNLIPSPPKFPMPSESSNSSWGSADLQFRRRRLRALGSLRPDLGQGLAAVVALRTLEVTTGPNPGAQACPGAKPAPDPAARPPGPPCVPHLNPITPAQSHP